MPKFPKMIYVKKENGERVWYYGRDRLEDHAAMYETHEIGIYELVKKVKIVGRGVVVK